MVPTTGSLENISQNGGPHYICSRSATPPDGLVDAVQNAVRRVCEMFVPRVFTRSVSTQLST
ncbi:hypothetical protein M404DRAFT_1006990 [Pisolithus tinctorius Marx 270]|uniref:Uncharacterized protein n=1 Tax=Pisolithus tinctorius Marx 270 TaxID=870435 RepID=A0A0C3N4X9_PISTI|nr:hypothetical protein M404DRAFT_1006990 [Pisolithus tinctorius Marx 270]